MNLEQNFKERKKRQELRNPFAKRKNRKYDAKEQDEGDLHELVGQGLDERPHGSEQDGAVPVMPKVEEVPGSALRINQVKGNQEIEREF